jgi:CrcB protein
VPHRDPAHHDPAEAVDPDVDLHVPRQRAELRQAPWAILGAISAGGVLGALARYGASEAIGSIWATFTINVTGCLLIGVLMVLITERWTAHRLVRPFLGVGVLGGFTTFSTYVVDAQRLLEGGDPRTALLYLAVTPLAALVAVYAGVQSTRAATRRVATRTTAEPAVTSGKRR